MMPLTFASVGQTAVIQRITGKDDVRQHLAELGFVAGEKVTIISSNGGNLILNIKGSRIALDASDGTESYVVRIILHPQYQNG